MVTAATVEPAATFSSCPTSTSESSGGTQLSMATSATSDRTLPDECFREAILALAWDETRDDLEPPGLRLERDLDWGGVQPAVREDQHHISILERVALEKHLRVAFLPLEPE